MVLCFEVSCRVPWSHVDFVKYIFVIMAGQSINDRLTAARYSIAGQGLAKSVCKATTEEVIGPKKKHLDCKFHLLRCCSFDELFVWISILNAFLILSCLSWFFVVVLISVFYKGSFIILLPNIAISFYLLLV